MADTKGTADKTKKANRMPDISASAPAVTGRAAAPRSAATAKEASIQAPACGRLSLAAVMMPGDRTPTNSPHTVAATSAKTGEGNSATAK